MFVKWRAARGVQLLIGALFAVAAVVVLYGATVGAQSGTSTANTIKVSPVRSDIEIKPGESKNVDITVTNLTGSDILVRPFENDFISSDEYGNPSLILGEGEYAPTHSLKRFMTPLKDVQIPARGAKLVSVKITVPKTAQAGGYFGALRFAPTTPDSGGQVNLSASVASLILLTVPGDVVEKVSLTDFEIKQGDKAGNNFRSSNDLNIAFRFENKGNLQAGPFGKISVQKGKDVVYETDFNSEMPRDVILPDGARKWEVPLKNIGSFGKYTVSSVFTYGTKNQTIEVVRTFWVLPMSVIIAAIAVLVLIVLVIAFVVWRIVVGRKRRHARRASGGMRLR